MISEISQFMTFKPGSELFALNVAKVREVLEASTITKAPKAPEYSSGWPGRLLFGEITLGQ
jgi:purine-binding chemotaxis protein CheW